MNFYGFCPKCGKLLSCGSSESNNAMACCGEMVPLVTASKLLCEQRERIEKMQAVVDAAIKARDQTVKSRYESGRLDWNGSSADLDDLWTALAALSASEAGKGGKK